MGFLYFGYYARIIYIKGIVNTVELKKRTDEKKRTDVSIKTSLNRFNESLFKRDEADF